MLRCDRASAAQGRIASGQSYLARSQTAIETSDPQFHPYNKVFVEINLNPY